MTVTVVDVVEVDAEADTDEDAVGESWERKKEGK